MFFYREVLLQNIVTDGLVMHLDAANSSSYLGGNSQTWFDLTPNGYNGDLLAGGSGALTFDTDKGGCFRFLTNTATIPTTNTTNYGNLTLSVWFNSGVTATNNRTLISKSSYYANSISDFPVAMFRNTDSIFCTLSRGDDYSHDAVLNINIVDNTWNNFTITFDQSTLNGYLNGIKTTVPANFSLSTNSQPWTVGRAAEEVGGGSGVTSYNDKIAVVLMYNRALSDSEVNQNFEAVRSRFNI